ncbi:MAG TPA: TspO/MBR family protein [Longimicrobiales bacterium]|nr:TspO/MBR family protein [Longimicrobiales bacterium]
MTAVLICLGTAAIEGICAGTKVRPFFASLRFPRYSAPLWVWSIIGAFYYLIFGYVLYRVLRLDYMSDLKSATIALVVGMMMINALTNYVIFRARNLKRAFVIGAIFPVLDIVLFVFLLQLDPTAAIVLIPYLIYRIYAVYWGYGLWKANSGTDESTANS